MEETEFAQGECSHPPLQDYVSDEFISNIYDSDVFQYDDEYKGLPIWPKWAEKTIEAAGDLASNPLDPGKTRSQFHTAFSTCEVNIAEEWFIMVGYYPQTYQEASLDLIWQKSMQEEFNSLQDNETWELVPLPSKRKLVQWKWVYRNKVFSYGSDIKYKARLVSKCFSQV